MIFLFSLLFVSQIYSLSLPSIFASSMVLPCCQKNGVIFWGTDAPDSLLTIVLSNSNNVNTTTHTSSNNKGFWRATIPSLSASHTRYTLTVSNNMNQQIVLTDVLFGYVYICSGQSNMELGVANTINNTQEIRDATRIGKSGVRILMVPLSGSYCNESVPQTNFTPSIPWSVANSNNIPDFSAVCYYFGKQQISKYPDIPIGLIATSWGGTAIEVWMSQPALKKCGAISSQNSFGNRKSNYDSIFKAASTLLQNSGRAPQCFPNVPSTLYNTMIYPFLTLPVQGFLWYQGESNAGNPVSYSRCFPELIKQWRNDWKTHSLSDQSDIPFFFVQISSWPNGDNDIIANQRYAQTFALDLPNVGMAVSADIGDPAGTFHPIHPPLKQEVSRRLFLTAEHLIFNNTSNPKNGPAIVAVIVNKWSSSWGSFHFDSGARNLCNIAHCFGVQIVFDQPLDVKAAYGRDFGISSGFRIVPKFDAYPHFQPMSFYGLVDGKSNTIQLNCSTVYSNASPNFELQYAWHDYPQMTLFNFNGQPVAPFNLSISVY